METQSSTPLTLLERFNAWIQESVMIKLFSIGFLILILLLPASWISELIYERQSRAGEALKEVSQKWSEPQTVSGPILVIPYKKQEKIDRGKDGVEIREVVEKAFFLPEELNIDGKIDPLILHRGIFEAPVYKSQLEINSVFKKPDFDKLNIAAEMVQWKDAHLAFGITDLRGISDTLILTVGSQRLEPEPSNNIGVTVLSRGESFLDKRYYPDHTITAESTTGITTKMNWQGIDDFHGDVKLAFNLKGSQRLDFVPAGKTTSVRLSGAWADPSFDGEFIPAERDITQDGFSAEWRVLHFNRPFAQQWTNEDPTFKGSGVKLLIPVDHYQKSIRTAKYSVLVILLTFLAMLMVEITQKIRIHPFQYILIGAALIIYYTLLLSFSEHLGYNIAYAVASAATVILISMYASSFIRQTRIVLVFSGMLTMFYGFIFVIILQQDFSLLLGSVGLFIIISAVMYLSRKINWYKGNRDATTPVS